MKFHNANVRKVRTGCSHERDVNHHEINPISLKEPPPPPQNAAICIRSLYLHRRYLLDRIAVTSPCRFVDALGSQDRNISGEQQPKDEIW